MPAQADSRFLRFSVAAALLALAGCAAELAAGAAATDSQTEVGVSHSGVTDVELSRLPEAVRKFPGVVGRFQALIDASRQARSATRRVALGRRLWRAAVAAAAAGFADDRALYWARLAMLASWSDLLPAERARFEAASRGMDDLTFPGDTPGRVVISGFDPFGLDGELGQSNPSGLAALMLDGAELGAGERLAVVEAVLMPVRFAGFDAGLVEAFFEPLLRDPNVTLIVTISMGRDAFDLERFPGRRRSAEVPDNQNVLTGASADKPLVPRLGNGLLPGPEFVEFSLPADAMRAVNGRWAVRDNRQVTTQEQGVETVGSLALLEGRTAVRGSGGGYLSNEISFRSVRLARALGSTVPIGHLHTPRLAGYDEATERQMVAQIRDMLTAAVVALTARR